MSGAGEQWFPCPSVALLIHPHGQLPMDAVGVLTVLRAYQFESPTGGLPADLDALYRLVKRRDDRGLTKTRFHTIWFWIESIFPLDPTGKMRADPDLAHKRAVRSRKPTGGKREASEEQAGSTPVASGQQASSKRAASDGGQPPDFIESDRGGRSARIDKRRGEETSFPPPDGVGEELVAAKVVRRPRKKAPAAPPLPFRADRAQALIAQAAGPAYVAVEPLPAGYAIRFEAHIRAYPVEESWSLLGEYIASGRAQFNDGPPGPSLLAGAYGSELLAKAHKWRDAGKPPKGSAGNYKAQQGPAPLGEAYRPSDAVRLAREEQAKLEASRRASKEQGEP